MCANVPLVIYCMCNSTSTVFIREIKEIGSLSGQPGGAHVQEYYSGVYEIPDEHNHIICSFLSLSGRIRDDSSCLF